MLGKRGDPNARRDFEGVVLAQEGLFQCPEDGVRRARSLRRIRTGEEDRELVATEAGDHVRAVDAFLQAGTNLAQQRIAHLMPKAVVDFFEIVDVEQKQDSPRVARDDFLRLFPQHEPIREVGQAVVERVVLERRLRECLASAQLRLLDRVLDRRSQPSQPVLQHVVHRPLPHGRDRHILTDGTRDDDEGDVEARLLHDFQGPHRVELRLVIVRQDEVELGVEVSLETGLVVHPAPGEFEAGPAQLVEDEFRVLRPVLQHQHAQRSSGHGSSQCNERTQQLVAAALVTKLVTEVGFVELTGYASTAAFTVIAALTVRDWLVTRDRGRMYLALAIGSLAAVSILGHVAKLVGPSFVGISAYVTTVIFLVSGLALLLFRHAVIPLKRRTLRVVVGIVIATALLEITVQAIFGRAAPPAVQLVALAAFVLVWSGCVGEPSIRLWLASRRRMVVQRARMRALSLGYLGIVAILVVAVFTTSLASVPGVRVGFALASLAIIPLLYAGFVPPRWLRRTWRQSEEDKFRQATHDILLYSSDQRALAQRSLDWAIRLTGADSGFFMIEPGEILAVQGIGIDEAASIQPALTGAGGRTVVPLGGTPPRSAMLARLQGNDAAIVLLSGPFTPVFGTDEEAWVQQYAAMVSTGLERVRLVEAVAKANSQLEDKVREVTERTRALEAANRELDAFSYTISHDLRAPLRAVNGFTSILFEEYNDSLPAEASRYLKRIKDSGEHMGHLVDDLLAFSRLGRQALRTQRVSIKSLVDRALEQLSEARDGRQVEIVIGNLPDVECDPILIEQVFVNLLSNALKYSRHREHARIEVGVLDSRDGEGPLYFVRDNGAGFNMEYAGKLFGVFQRLHRTEDYEGTGVGLAIVQRVVERHGGRIWAEAKVDEGATFYFTLKGAQAWRTATAA